ncbi:MAG TPA: SPFH domain-containing protein, partial [Gemmataceae bacterium]|nr:SPFH domain-containing protein [Gemmataceae bacterium]
FDKTGTLTEGRLELGDIVPLGGISPDELLCVAACAEQRSEHPLAQVILKDALARGLVLEPIEEFRAHPGAGIVATFASRTSALPTRVVVGSPRLLEEQGLPLSTEIHGVLERLDQAGQTALLVARDGAVLGAIGARDRVRPEAAGVLMALRHDGITDIALLTGDRPAAAKAVAAELGITEVHAELLPQEKAEFIAAWKRQHAGKAAENNSWLDRLLTGRPSTGIGMVGDGINDAPALASADAGLAMGGTGSDIAAEAGDVVLMGDPLRSLPLLLRLSRQTVQIIRQNILLFAFGVNAVGILLTAWLWPLLLPVEWHSDAPVAAVIYHQLGSLAVLLNAMRLLWFERTGPSRGMQSARRRLDAIDRWMDHYLNLDQALHWLSHHGKAAAVVVGVVGLTGYAASGLTRINPDEVGVVCRFGRPLPQDLEPGLAWRWPWPIETVVRARPDAVQMVEIGFRSPPGRVAAPGGLGWASAHDSLVPEPEESLMMTGDGNLVELQATVRYAIRRDRLRTYLFEVRDPAEVVRSTAESVLRETIAGRPFLDLLTSSRAKLQSDVLARLTRRCAELGSDGLGIRLEGFSVHDLHPPKDVQPAYKDVIRAMQDRDRQINEAQAEAKRTLSRAQARARQTVADAEARAATKVLQATTERERYLAWYGARHTLGAGEQWQILRAMLGDMARGSSWRQAYATAKERYQQRLAMQAVLTDFRLFWEALGGALKDRQTVIVDAENVPGRRHLFLFDMSQLRLPALTQQERK